MGIFTREPKRKVQKCTFTMGDNGLIHSHLRQMEASQHREFTEGTKVTKAHMAITTLALTHIDTHQCPPAPMAVSAPPHYPSTKIHVLFFPRPNKKQTKPPHVKYNAPKHVSRAFPAALLSSEASAQLQRQRSAVISQGGLW